MKIINIIHARFTDYGFYANESDEAAPAIFHHGGMHKVLPQMWDVLQELELVPESDVIHKTQVLADLPHIPDMRDHP